MLTEQTDFTGNQVVCVGFTATAGCSATIPFPLKLQLTGNRGLRLILLSAGLPYPTIISFSVGTAGGYWRPAASTWCPLLLQLAQVPGLNELIAQLLPTIFGVPPVCQFIFRLVAGSFLLTGAPW